MISNRKVSVCNQSILNMISYWIGWNAILRSLSTKSMSLQYDFVLNTLEFHTGKPQYEINVSSFWFRTEYAGIPYWEASLWNQCNFNMISYWISWNFILRSRSTKSMYLQYDFPLNMLDFHTGKPQYEINVSSVWFRTVYNMLLFHTTEKPQYGINVTSEWFPTEYAGIPNWEASACLMYLQYYFVLSLLKFHT